MCQEPGHLLMFIAVSSFGERLRWEFLTAPAEADFKAFVV